METKVKTRKTSKRKTTRKLNFDNKIVAIDQILTCLVAEHITHEHKDSSGEPLSIVVFRGSDRKLLREKLLKLVKEL